MQGTKNLALSRLQASQSGICDLLRNNANLAEAMHPQTNLGRSCRSSMKLQKHSFRQRIMCSSYLTSRREPIRLGPACPRRARLRTYFRETCARTEQKSMPPLFWAVACRAKDLGVGGTVGIMLVSRSWHSIYLSIGYRTTGLLRRLRGSPLFCPDAVWKHTSCRDPLNWFKLGPKAA